MKLHLRIAGEWRFTKLDAASRQPVLVTPWWPNLITNIGLDRIGEGLPIGPFVRIGTGTTAAAASDQALVAQVASASTVVGVDSLLNAGAPDYETNFVRTVEFAQGAVVGNMGEIGLGWSTSGNTLWARSRIVDGSGNPTTISVGALEILQATYRIRAYPTLTDATGTVDISGTTHNYTSRVSQVGATRAISWAAWLGLAPTATVYAGLIGATTGIPAGVTAAAGSGTYSPYTAGTYYRDFTIPASISQANVAGGIRSIVTFVGTTNGTVWQTQTEYDPVILKDNTKQFSLPFRISWGRH